MKKELKKATLFLLPVSLVFASLLYIFSLRLFMYFSMVSIFLMLYGGFRYLRKHQKAASKKMDQKKREATAEILLFNLLDFDKPIPVFSNSALPSLVLNDLIHKIYQEERYSILETGSGLSTVVLAKSLKMIGQGKIHALEHSEYFLERTHDLLELHNLQSSTELLHTPLDDVHINDSSFTWYDFNMEDVPNNLDLLIVDGPPAHLGSNMRYPVLPILWDRLAQNCLIYVDDTDREEEREMISKWQEKFPPLTKREVVNPIGRGTYLRKE